VGTGYFDAVTQVIAGGMSSVTALAGSTEAEQFAHSKPQVPPKSGSDATYRQIIDDYPSMANPQLAEPGLEESLMPSGD